MAREPADQRRRRRAADRGRARPALPRPGEDAADRRRRVPRGVGRSSSGSGPAPSSGHDGLPPDLLHERVDDEWSFIETLRHLVFATDAWVRARDPRRARRRGTRSTCPTTRCPTSPACRATATRDRRWTRCWHCAPTGWRPCGRCSPASPTSGWPARPSRCWSPATRSRESYAVTPLPAGHPQRGVGAPALRRARPRGARSQLRRGRAARARRCSAEHGRDGVGVAGIEPATSAL